MARLIWSISDPEPYGFERAAAGKALLAGASCAAGSGEASAAGAVASSLLLSTGATGTSLGMARTVRGGVCLCSTDKLSSDTTSGALLGAESGCGLGCFSTLAFSFGADTALAASAWGFFGCFKLRTSEAPAAEAVTHTINAMPMDTQRGRSLGESTPWKPTSAGSFGRSLLRVTGAAGIGEGIVATGTTAATAGASSTGGGGGEGRGDDGIGVASAPSRGSCAGRGKGVLKGLDSSETRGSGAGGRVCG